MKKQWITWSVALIGALAVLGASSEASAQARYGMAGCGLGSMVFGDQPGIVQVFAATTNATFATQTFGITTGTSNCTDSGGGYQSAKAFIETNREAVAKDIARGQGETISSIATLAGCENSGAVGAVLQSEFELIFPDASVSDTAVSQSVLKVLGAHSELSCGATA